MKKTLSVIALLLAVVMIAMGCAACGDDKKEDISSASDSTQAQKDADPAGTGAQDDSTGAAPGSEADTPGIKPGENPSEGQGGAASSSSIVGTWRYVMDFKSLLAEQIDSTLSQVAADQKKFYEELFESFSGVSIDMVMEFKNDGSYHFGVDELSAKEAIEKMKKNLKTHLPTMLESIGSSLDAFETALAQQGATVDDYIDLLFSQQMNMESWVGQAESSGAYRYENDCIYLSVNGEFDENDYAKVSLDGNTLTIIEIVGTSGSFPPSLLPMIFTRG